MSAVRTQEWLQSFRSQMNAPQSSALLGPLPRLMCVTGGKGGIGKTSVALKMGLELSKKDYRVLLIDCDYNLSNTLVKLGLPLEDHFYDLLMHRKELRECVHEFENLHLLAGCNGHLELFDHNFSVDLFVQDLIQGHTQDYDLILIDCPAGMQQEFMKLCARADYRFMVVTPEKASLTDAYSVMKVLSKKYGVRSNHLIVNKVDQKHQAQRVIKTMSETAQNFIDAITIPLGAIRRLQGSTEDFDRNFFWDEKNATHRSFNKIIDALTEELCSAAERGHLHPLERTRPFLHV